MLERFFKYKFHIRPFFNPLIWFQISKMGEFKGVNGRERENKIIISLTSYKKRFKNLPLTLYSLLNQSLKPDRIILWLDKDEENLADLPYEITRFIKNGLEIRFVKDIRSYTKAIYAFKEFSDKIIVTADDDIYYSKDWLEKLYFSYVTNPEDIHVHRAHRVKVNSKGKLMPYETWLKQVDTEGSAYYNFLTGVGGVLYPKNCFSKEVLREDIFLKAAPYADDIWFWVMALLHNRKIRVVRNHSKYLLCTSIFNQLFSRTLYSYNKNGGNDDQLEGLMKFYRSNIENKLSEVQI